MGLPRHWRRAAFALGLLVATSGLVAACSSGDAAGSDEDYVKSICEANDILDEVLGVAITAALSGEEPDDEALDDVASAFERWLDALEDANPPADAADAHEAVIDTLGEAIGALRSGDSDFESMFDDIEDPPEPPQAVQDRLNAAAADVAACEDTELF